MKEKGARIGLILLILSIGDKKWVGRQGSSIFFENEA
jgi:hypothetical protein